MRRVIRRQRTIVGRLQRQIQSRVTTLTEAIRQTLSKAARVVDQTANRKTESPKLYSFEPVIGHLKNDHRMGRCHLKGVLGDKMHAVLCAAGYNIKWLLRMIVKKGLRAFFVSAPGHGGDSRMRRTAARSPSETRPHGPRSSQWTSLVRARGGLKRFIRNDYIDANRALDEIDDSMLDEPWPGLKRPGAKVGLGKGLVWRALDDGTPLYDRTLSVAEVQARINRCWMPYHGVLARTIDGLSRHHRQLIHLNCHSMPSMAAAFSTEFPGVAHPDVVLGDRDGTTADSRLTRAIGRFFEARGYSVAINHPYKGVEIVRRYGGPEFNRHSIQVELNRRLYMDEQTLAPHAGYLPLRNTLRDLVVALLALDLRDGDVPEQLAPARSESALTA